MTRTKVALLAASVAVAVALATAPLVASRLVRTRLQGRLSEKLGRRVAVERVRMGWGRIELRSLSIDGGPGNPPPLFIPVVRASFLVGPLFRKHLEVVEAEVDHPRLEVVRGEPGDNISFILDRLRTPSEGRGGRRGGWTVALRRLNVVRGSVAVIDVLGPSGGRDRAGQSPSARSDGGAERSGTLIEASLGIIDGEIRPDEGAELKVAESSIEVGGARAAAVRMALALKLDHHHLVGLPYVEIAGGSASPVRGLALTGIEGTFKPDPADPLRGVVEVHGSYGGATTPLWNASGWLRPDVASGEIKLRAARFKLSQLDSVLNREAGAARVLNAHDAEVDARLDLAYARDVLGFSGAFHLAGLTVANAMLAPVPVARLGFDAHTTGRLDVKARALHLAEAVVDYRNVHATLAAEVENLGPRPRFSATLKVRPLPCQVALQALPAELTPSLQGFKVQGTFSTDLHLGLDLSNLDTPIDLGGKVGIEGCKVLEAPQATSAERLGTTFEQTVEVEPGKWLTFFAGPENPDWVPFPEISQHLINSIMTTEDSGFFKHKGFIPSEFRSALQQNLQRGYFRLGASSITMQMVKNVLLSREKTLSRKLQELFLTWHVEHSLTKERIMEIYFNVIEFGPGLYGIGRATRHYFGKPPKDLAPQEAVWFSSILPNPKRRYVQFCHANGMLDQKWDTYLKRILRRMHERGRLTDEEYEKAVATPLKFDRKEAMPEKDCMALVKRLTTPLVPPGSAPAKALAP